MIYQASVYKYYVSSTASESSNREVKFLGIFALIMGGALVPLVVRLIVAGTATVLLTLTLPSSCRPYIPPSSLSSWRHQPGRTWNKG